MEWMQNLKFNGHGHIAAIVQEEETKEVLMFAYMNQEALEKTIETGKAHYYSRSRQKLWLKGEESGHFQLVKKIQYDCDADALLLTVEQVGGACHTGRKSCFFNEVKGTKVMQDDEKVFDEKEVYSSKILKDLYQTIAYRKVNPKEGSYTNYLFEKGVDKILKKVGEETAEVIIAAKNPGNEELIYEASDLLYHLMVLLVEKETNLEDVFKELESRKK